MKNQQKSLQKHAINSMSVQQKIKNTATFYPKVK